MSLPALPPAALRQVVAAALAEDLGRAGDITTDAVVPPGRTARGRVVARQEDAEHRAAADLGLGIDEAAGLLNDAVDR